MMMSGVLSKHFYTSVILTTIMYDYFVTNRLICFVKNKVPTEHSGFQLETHNMLVVCVLHLHI